jgi:hypothetical protein
MISSEFSRRILICFSVTLLAGPISVEAEHPAPLTLADLKRMSSCELEQVFAHGKAIVPVGKLHGHILCRVEGKLARVRARLGGAVWKGKEFCEDGSFTNRWLMGIRAIPSCAVVASSWYDERPCVVLDYEPGTPIFGNARDEIREVACGLFLARFYRRCPCPLLEGYFALEAGDCCHKH